jgi:alkylhydroperoxidase family enzyme
MAPYLPPVEKPRGLMLRLVYFFTRRQFGKVPTPIAVHSARMPEAFLSFYGKVSRLDKKLELSADTAVLVRERVASTNSCLFCMDTQQWYVQHKSPQNLARLDALPEYQTSPLFSDAERAALDYATELTRDKHVAAESFARLRHHYREREICDIVWLVASEHLYNMTNHGLNIGSDDLCELRPAPSATVAKDAAPSRPTAGARGDRD